MTMTRLLIACILAFAAVLCVVPVVSLALTPNQPLILDETSGDATLYFAAEPERVLSYESCQQVEWQLEGIQAVKLNGRGVIGAGTDTICGTSPWLEVTFQDGTAEYFWLPRIVTLSATARLNLLCAVGLLLLVPIVLGARPAFVTRLLTRLRQIPTAILVSLVIVTLVGAGIRLLYADIPMWIDEGRTFMKYGAQSLDIGLSQYDEPGNHLFHTLLVHLSYRFFGSNENWVVRLPAILAGIFVIPAVFAVGAALKQSIAGLIAAALVSASTVMIAYSVNARGYTLLCLFTCLTIYVGIRQQQEPRRLGWLLMAVLATLGFYTLPTMLFPYTAIMVWLFLWFIWSQRGPQRTRRIIGLVVSGLITVMLTLLVYLPVISTSGINALVGNVYVTAQPWSAFWAEYIVLPDTLARFFMRNVPVVIQIIVGAALIIGLLPRKKSWNTLSILAIITVAVTLSITLVQRVVAYSRVLLFLWPILALVAGHGFKTMLGWLLPNAERQLKGAAVFAVAYAIGIGALIVTNGEIAESSFVEMEDLTDQIQSIIRPTDGIATIMRTHNFEYYLMQHEFPMSAAHFNTTQVARLYLVVRNTETPEEVIIFNGMNPDAFMPPTLLTPNKHYSLYVTDQIED